MTLILARALSRRVQSMVTLFFTWVISLKLLCLWRFGQFDVLVGYFSLPDFTRLSRILLAVSVVVFGVSMQVGSAYAPPRSVVLADLSFSVLALTACTHAICELIVGSRIPESFRASRIAVAPSPAICAEVTMKWTLWG